MISRNPCRDERGTALVDIVLALSVGAIFVAILSDVSMAARSSFDRAQVLMRALDAYASGAGYYSQPILYGNDMVERIYSGAGTAARSFSISSYGLDAARPLSYAAGAPYCSVDIYGELRDGKRSRKGIVSEISLPVSPSVGSNLTDLQVRDGIAYISVDSPIASDPDMFVIDISDSSAPRIKSSLDTGPGIAGFALAGRRIYAAAASAAAQLHILKLDSLDALSVESRFKIPLPYATATPAIGSAISYSASKIYLGTDRWDGRELSVIDVSRPDEPYLLGGVEIGGKVAAISARGGAILIGAAGQNQLVEIDATDPAHPVVRSAFSPPGWRRQQAAAVSSFEAGSYLGRTAGGFDIASDHELFGWPAGLGNASSSLDVPYGIYGVVADRSHVYAASRRNGGELDVFDRSLSASSAAIHPLPGPPESLTCDGSHLYALAHGAPFLYDIYFSPESE